MKVLFVVGTMPCPPDTGGKLRTCNLLRQLSKRHEITLLTFSPDSVMCPEDTSSLAGRVVAVPRPRKSPLTLCKEIALAPARRDPLIATRYHSPAMAHTLYSLLRREEFDILHCDSISVARCAGEFAHIIPCCMGTHNIETSIWERLAQTERNILKRIYIRDQFRKVRRYEANIFKRFTAVTAVSETDAKSIQDCHNLQAAVVPNGVDTDYFRPNDSQADPKTITFIGSMDWRPNIDAALYFHKEIWPLVRAKVPDARFSIVGRKPVKQVLELAQHDPNTSVTGTVEDVRQYLADASVCVVPIRIGGGSRIKILEALSACRPVISTTIGAEGLEDLTRWMSIADRPDLFADRVVEHLTSPGIRGSETAREYIISHYSWSRIADKLESIWQQIACSGGKDFLE